MSVKTKQMRQVRVYRERKHTYILIEVERERERERICKERGERMFVYVCEGRRRRRRRDVWDEEMEER